MACTNVIIFNDEISESLYGKQDYLHPPTKTGGHRISAPAYYSNFTIGLNTGTRHLYLTNLYAYTAQEFYTFIRMVVVTIHDTLNARLYYQLGALYTRGSSYIQRSAVAVVGAFGQLCNGIGLGMQNIRLGFTRLVLTYVLEPRRSAVITVGDYHLVLDDQRPHLSAYTIRILGPYLCHANVTHVELSLFLFLISHNSSLFTLAGVKTISSCLP